MPINYDALTQAHEKVNSKAGESRAAREREEQEEKAREINYLMDYLGQLGIKADLYGYTLYAFIHVDGFSFALETQTNDAMRNRFFRIMRIQTGGSECLLLPFYSLPDTWHPDHKHNFQARLHEVLSRLNHHNAMPAPQDDEQPLDLMPTTLIMDDCEAAYEMLKQARGLVGEALGYCTLSSHDDVKGVLYLLSAKLNYFLGEADEPAPDEDDSDLDDGQDENGDPLWLKHIESTEYIPEIDEEDTYTEDDYPASVPTAAAPVDPFIALVRSGDFVILDTETTGLGNDAEICQIAIIDSASNVLLDTLVKPQKPIPTSATAIHHISNEMVKDAPIWLNVNEKVWQALHGKTVIVYNADYDFRLIVQSEKACEPLATSDWHTIKRECAMLKFAEIYGDWNDYHGNYRWQKLDKAARYYDLPVNAAHTALGDCLMTLAICKAMAAAE
jgi:DNA polymerase III subunit epsilon